MRLMRTTFLLVLVATLAFLFWLMRDREVMGAEGNPRSKAESQLPAVADSATITRSIASPLGGATPLPLAEPEDGLLIEGRLAWPTKPWNESVEMSAWSSDWVDPAYITCATDGAFQLAIPRATASVSFRLPPVFRILHVSGATQVDDDSFRVDGARDHVLVELEVLPHALFQLLLEEGRIPLAHHGGMLLIFYGTSDSRMKGFQTDANGLVRAPMHWLEEATEIHIQISEIPAGSYFSQSFTGEFLRSHPGPHEILVRIGAQVPFFAHGLDGRPVAGARVGRGQGSGIPSGMDGQGHYVDSVPHAAEVTFYAPGQVETRVLVSDPPPELLDVAMPRASTLTVRVENHRQEQAQSYLIRVRFLREGFASVLAPSEHRPGWLTIGRHYSTKHFRSGGPIAHEATLAFNESGLLLLDGIYTDLIADVEVAYAGLILHRERVQFILDGGAHEVIASGSFAARTVSGRVTDEMGAAQAGVQVMIGEGDGVHLSMNTDSAGAFTFHNVPAEVNLLLRCEQEGFVPARAIAEAGVLECKVLLICPRARSVSVTAIREDGRPFLEEDGTRVKAQPEAVLPDGSVAHCQDGEAGNVWVFPALPPGFVTFRFITSGGNAEVLHDTSQSAATLILRRP